VQLKPANNFRTETRPAPSVYRPQTQLDLRLRTNSNALQPKAISVPGVGFKVIQRSRNLKNLKCYRPGFYQEVVKAFTAQGYSGSIDPDIERGLTAWKDSIPGHCSSKAGKDSGEQGETGPKCEEARDFLVTWVQTNPAPVRSSSSSSSHIRTVSDKEDRKEKRKIEKREEYQARINVTPEYVAPWNGGPSSYYRPSWKG
jgi:hypothetical protein